MKIWCDGSRVNAENGEFAIGWAAVCKDGVLYANGRHGGSNINAEMFAIRDALQNILKYRRSFIKRIVEKDAGELLMITDSLTSLQIIKGYLIAPQQYDLSESENYMTADEISGAVKRLSELGVTVNWKHIRGHGKDDTMDEVDVLGNAFADQIATEQSEKYR